MGTIRKTVLLLMCVALAVSCSKEIASDWGPVPGQSETVRFSIRIPGAADGGAASRALAGNDAECTLSDIDVLQFTSDGKFAYRAVAYNITGSGASRSFEARLLAGTHSIVIVANARAQVNDAVNGTNGVAAWDRNTLRQDALDKLKFTVPATAKLTSDGVMPNLPMFGYVEMVDVQNGLKLEGTNAVKMVRSVAKIEVQITAKAASGADGGTGNSNFRLLDARLYNQPLEGWAVPDVDTWNTATNLATTAYYGGAAAPAKAVYPDNDPLVYAGPADHITDNNI
ncbi:MAG: hypothetical protein LIO68_00040, partial [Rikenellaceae bacterium]|nr:hypothetical protein [Rikenellaceae bacterium]